MINLKQLILLFLLTTYVNAEDFPQIEGWKPVSEIMYYNQNNLWEYINGAADQFIDYGFENLRVQEFSTDSVTISVDIYDMKRSLAAFGIYTTESRGITPRLSIGTEAVITPPSQALMIKDKYYIKISAFKGQLSQTRSQEVLESIVEDLPGKSGFPKEIYLLPKKNRIPGSIGFSGTGYLGLSELNNCLYARYRKTGEKDYEHFLIVPEIDQDKIPDILSDKWKKTDLDRYSVWFRKIPYQDLTGLIITDENVFGVTNSKDEKDLLNKLKIFCD